MTANSGKSRAMAFQMTRVFNTPRERLWKAWSEAGQLQQWWGPRGCTVTVARLEFTPGGFFHYAMHFDGAPATWGRFNYRQIATLERIVWLNSFSNENCGIARAPFSDVCPFEIENTVTFTERAGATTVSLQAEPFGETAAERQFFNELCSSGSLEQGYAGTFDKLADWLAKA
jgi:uncharacterized protein YndB with AHSA1/START domain